MRNKKSLLSLGLVALVLVLGVGYAVVSNVGLKFGGSATVADAALKVDIASVSYTAPTGVTVTNTLTEHSKNASFEITGMTLNDTVTITYTVDSHETDVAAVLTEKTALTGANEYFTASYKINGADVAAGGSTTVTVTVTMAKTPVSTANSTANFAFELDAAPVQ